MKNLLLAALVIIAMPIIAAAQKPTAAEKCCKVPSAKPTAVSAATGDMAIDKEKTKAGLGGPGLKFHAEAFNNFGDDCNYDVKAIVLLPANVTVKKMEAHDEYDRPLKVTQCNGMLTVHAGQVCPSAGEDTVHHYKYFKRFFVNVATTMPLAGTPDKPSFGIVVYGCVADSHPDNNYWWWKGE